MSSPNQSRVCIDFPGSIFRGVRTIALCLAIGCGVAHAQTPTAPREANQADEKIFSINGFGTLGLVHSSERNADFIAHDLQLRGAGRNGKWSAEVDSRLGVQVDARFNSQFSGVVQVTSEQRYDGSYRPEIEWANLKYQITPDFNVRVGRIVLPTFLLSDSRKVGYASPWVRPPVEVYSLIPLTRADGIDMSLRHNVGGLNNTLQAHVGRSTARIPADDGAGGKVIGKNGWGLSDTLEYGAATLHFAYIRTDGTITSYKQLFDGYRALGAQLAPYLPSQSAQALALAGKYDPNKKPFSIMTLGASYDPGKWFLMGEYGIIDTHSVYGKRAGWYATGGYRIGKFTPYVSYAVARRNSKASDPGVSVPAVPAGHPLYDAYIASLALNAALNDQLGSAPVQKTTTLGVRWDAARNVSVKAQFDSSDMGAGSPGSLDHGNASFTPGGRYKVFSLTVDFVF